jgi:hypothetical protein
VSFAAVRVSDTVMIAMFTAMKGRVSSIFAMTNLPRDGELGGRPGFNDPRLQ